MLTLRKAEERGHANFGWLDSRHSFSFGTTSTPSTWASVRCASSTTTASPAGAGFPHASARRHGDHLLRAGRRAGAQGQPRHRIGDPARRRAAHVGRHRHPPQRVQCLEDRAGALPADLDRARAARGSRRATSRRRSPLPTSAASCASSARATAATARSRSIATSTFTPPFSATGDTVAHELQSVASPGCRSRAARRRSTASSSTRVTALRVEEAGKLELTGTSDAEILVFDMAA